MHGDPLMVDLIGVHIDSTCSVGELELGHVDDHQMNYDTE